ncbi:MAG: hypothetical protein Fur0011_6500 [Candidatus Microgenomates bacterium]
MTKYLYPAGVPIYILSPHFDDAAFSLGSFMSTYASHNPIKVINIFTQADSHPPTLSARAFLSQIGTNDPIELFNKRRQEDKKALFSLGVTITNWGAVDALWRRHSDNSILPEIGANYPTYRFHISRGRVSSHDQYLIKQLKSKLLKTLPKIGDYRLIVPLGHGGHVDHVIARQIGEAMVPATKLCYYLDFPYSIRDGVLIGHAPISHKPISIPTNVSRKKALCELYVSQFTKVIPDPSVLSSPETIFIFDDKLPKPKATLTTHLKAFIASPKNYLFSLINSSSTKPTPLPKVCDSDDKQVHSSFIKYLSQALPSVIPQGIGSVTLGVAGRGDLDILIPVTVAERNRCETTLTKLLGSPSYQNSYMTQWKTQYHGRPVDLDLILEGSPRYLEQNYLLSLLSNDEVHRREYEVHKYNCTGTIALYTMLLRIIFLDGYLLSQKLLSAPKRLGSLVLVKAFVPDQNFPGPFIFGEYKDQNDNRYIAKIHVGSAYSKAAGFLRNEARIYQQLKPTSRVSAPSLYAYHEAYNYRYLILSKVVGHDLTKVEPKTQVKAITECIAYLDSQPKLHGIQYRPALYWLSLLPFLIILNIIKGTLPIMVIIRLTFYSIKQALYLLFRPLTLVHRDLNYQNCFVTKKGLSLIDYQLTAYADPLLEYAVILLKYSLQPSFIKSITKTSRYKRLVNNAVHGRGVLGFYLVVIGLYDLILNDGRHAVTRPLLIKLSENRISL